MNYEPAYYKPRFFDKSMQVNKKNGKQQPVYKLRKDDYWKRRLSEASDKWAGVPKIYEDDCEAFY